MSAVTVNGTDRPWPFFGSGADNPGSANTNVGANAGFNDGSNAGGIAGLNTGYRYGRQHVSPAGETSTEYLIVFPGSSINVMYVSGTIAAFSGATVVGPTGDGSVPLGPNFTDSGGYVYPTDYISGATTGRCGLVGAFLDANFVILSTWDWKHSGGTDAANNSVNFTAPTGSQYMAFGVNDTILGDNTGSFSLTVINNNAEAGWAGGVTAGLGTSPSKTSGDSVGGLPVSAHSRFALTGTVFSSTPSQGQLYPTGTTGTN